MDAIPYLPQSLARSIRYLHRELMPFPWRINLAMRCVLASAIVIVASMTLEIPALGLSLLCVFYTTQSNVVVTRLVGPLFMLASTLAVGLCLLLFIFTFDYPLLRIVGANLIFFVSAFLMRVLKVGTIFFIVAIVVIYLQSLVDQIPAPEPMVRLALWAWAAMNYAILVTLIVNTLLLPIEPVRQLKEEIHRQLGEVGAELLRLQQGARRVRAPDPAQALAGVLTLQKLLQFAAMRDKQYRADRAYQLALIGAVSALRRAASGLPTAIDAPAAARAGSLRPLQAECAALDAAAQATGRYRLAAAAPPETGQVAAIADMWRTLYGVSALGLQQTAAENQARQKEPMLAPDAFTNPAYVRFALKALMAVLLAYVFYNAVQWQGIHTVMLTCLIVALPSLGASTQKALLRIGGALVGSALALFMVIFVIPRIDSITGLLLMTLPVVGLGAWIAAGTERISYAGIQIVFTFSLAVLERFGPTTDLTEIRDRMVGILLGVTLAVTIQTLIWPEREGAALRRKLAELISSVARLTRTALPEHAEGEHLTYVQQHMRALTDFGTTQAMLARVAIEPAWSDDANQLVAARAQAVLASVRGIMRASEKLHQQDTQEPALHLRVAVEAVRVAVADELERYGAALLADPPNASKPASLSAAMPGALADQAAAAETPHPVVRAAQDLLRHLDGMPDWTEARPPHPEPVTAALRT